MILVCRRMLAGAAIILVLCLSYGESVNILEQEPTSNSSWTMNVSSTYSLSISSIVLLYEKLFESLQLGSAVNISDQCANATHLLVQAVRAEESWALRMIDALGKPSSGILQGSVVFLGYYSECVKTTAILPVDGKSSIPFRGKYCLPTLSFGASTSTLPKGILGPSYNVLRSNNPKIGLCVPSTCFMEDVSLAFNKALKEVATGWTATISHCYTNDKTLFGDVAAVSVMAILLVIVSLVIIGTVYELFLKMFKETNFCFTKNKQVMVPNMNASSEVLCESKQYPGSTNKVRLVLTALSLKCNAQKLLNTSRSEESIDVLHGIRVLTIFWIITGHSCSFALRWLFFRSSIGIGSVSQSLWIQPLVNGTLSVDTFFFLSGFLVTFLTLKKLKKSEGKFHLGLFYFHRYWRMTPLMMVLIAFSAVILRYVFEGPAWLDTIIMYDAWCRKNWWLNALYLQNFIDTSNMCLSHSWYSAVDFQFYLVSPIIIYPLYRDIRWGLPILLGFFVLTSVVTGVITGSQHLPPVPLLTKAIPESVMNNYSSMVYIKPYCRMGPFLVGVTLGYILYCNGGKMILKKRYVILGWFLAFLCSVLALYGMWPAYEGQLPNNLASAMYSALARTAWAIGLAWLTFACTAGYGGFITTLLSWRGFVPLSRLTYSAYLIHPVAMAALYGEQELTVDATFGFMMYLIFGNLVFTFILAFILSLFFEFPFAGLENVILKRDK